MNASMPVTLSPGNIRSLDCPMLSEFSVGTGPLRDSGTPENRRNRRRRAISPNSSPQGEASVSFAKERPEMAGGTRSANGYPATKRNG